MALPNSQFWSDDNQTERKIFINDANQDLITTYELLRNQPKRLVTALGELAQDISPERYYEIRASRPKTKTDTAARFIYLNRLCFNGLHRVNSKGEFNVPYGKLKNPKVCDESLLLAVSQVLKKAEISQGGFETAVATARKGDLVYFDPPYVPLTATASFSSYSVAGFNEADQRRLAQVIDKLVARGVRVILSNSSADLSREIYQDRLSLFAVKANRSISASGGSRKSVDEILGLSYYRSECVNPNVLKPLKYLNLDISE
jgi:DNA adenine methylase